MSALRVGIDLVEVRAVRESVRRHADRYLERIYTEREVADSRGADGVDPGRLAARFAAKEAVVKLLRPGREDAVPWRSIEVVRAPEGWVELELHEPAASLAERAGLTGLAVSLTHEAGFASAAVVAESSNHEEPR